MRHLIIGLLFLLTSISAAADSNQPIDVLRRGIDESLRVLNSPCSKSAHHGIEQQRQLRRIMFRLFDFHEFSRRVLASHWKTFTAEEKSAFVDVFAEFLAAFYVAEVLEKYRDERVVYLKETLETPTRARVNVAVVWRGNPVPVDLGMIKRNQTWKVYEIQVLGISAIVFYRAQFQSLLKKETPAQVIDRIRRRIRQIDQPS